MSDDKYRLTAQERRRTCVHEAAHAVIFALGGATVYDLAVAPEGSTGWTFTGRKGGLSSDLWGICSPSDMYLPMRWSEDASAYELDSAGWSQLRKAISEFPNGKRVGRAQLTCIRAHACAALAGPLSELLLDGGQDPYIEPLWERGEDATLAAGYCRFLPYWNEYEHLTEVTVAALREPDIWARVISLADALGIAGHMQQSVDAFLPQRRDEWPSSPRSSTTWVSRTAHVARLRSGFDQ